MSSSTQGCKAVSSPFRSNTQRVPAAVDERVPVLVSVVPTRHLNQDRECPAVSRHPTSLDLDLGLLHFKNSLSAVSLFFLLVRRGRGVALSAPQNLPETTTMVPVVQFIYVAPFI